MLAYYAEVKWLHVAAVCVSGALFALRGLLVLAGRGAIARHVAVRYASYTIDSVLLTAALMLFTMLPRAVFANGWLAVKLALVVGYIVLGVFALRDGGTPRRRAAYFVAALAVFATVVSIARAHHPFGALAGALA